ncbi:MAG: tyrosine--tRNA ligase, partial [Calditerricola sp.]|nr:tyrosine--tRNA ligase [Calditerricola sp.]
MEETKARNGEEAIVLTADQEREVERQLAVIARGVAEILPEEELRRKLARSV